MQVGAALQQMWIKSVADKYIAQEVARWYFTRVRNLINAIFQIRNFSLQLLHRKVDLTVYGFLCLNYNLIFKVWKHLNSTEYSTAYFYFSLLLQLQRIWWSYFNFTPLSNIQQTIKCSVFVMYPNQLTIIYYYDKPMWLFSINVHRTSACKIYTLYSII